MITQQTYINYVCCKNESFVSLAKLNGVTTPPYYLKEIGKINIFYINKFKFYASCINLTAIFFQIILTCSQIHHHDTRDKRNIHPISHNTTMRSFSIRVQGPLLWNLLDPLIKQCKKSKFF